MGLKLTHYTVTSSPTLILTVDIEGSQVKIGNTSGETVFLGDANVTYQTGLPLIENASQTFDCMPGTEIYAIVEDTSGSVAVLEY